MISDFDPLDNCPGPIPGCPCEDCAEEAEAQAADFEEWQEELSS